MRDMLKPTCHKKAYFIIALSCGLLLFSNYSIFAAPDDWALDFGWSFIIDNNDKIFYSLGEDLSDIGMQSDRLRLIHESGTWGFQYEGQESNITDLADSGNNFITTLNNNATIAVISNNTVYWDPNVDNPKFVNITTVDEVQIIAANFKQNLAAFNLASPPAVFVDLTQNQIIVKSNHTVEETTIKISFQEEVATGIFDILGGALIIGLLVFGFIIVFIIALIKRKK